MPLRAAPGLPKVHGSLMRTFALPASLWLAALSPAQAPSPEPQSPQAAFAAFEAAVGGRWVVQWHPATGTPSSIYGTGLHLDDWRGNSLDEARRQALLLLTKQHDLLGLGTSDFVESIGARMGRSWSFKFDQSFHGVPVIGGRADVRINMTGVVAMFGSRAWPVPANFDVQPAIADSVATATAWAALGAEPNGVPQPRTAPAPRLVIWGDGDAPQLAPFALAWEVAISNVDAGGQGPIGRYYVDAKTGAVLHYRNDKHDRGIPGCGVATHAPAVNPTAAAPVLTTVTVMGWTNTGIDAFDPEVNIPMVGLVLNVPGVGNVTTDANGQFTVDIAAPVNISVGALDGRHHGPMIGPNGPTGTFTINPGVNATIQLLTAAATTLESAHTNTAYWVESANEWVRTIVGNSAQMNTADNVSPTVNIGSTCNAYYTGNTINFYQAGGGCSNTAFSTVIVHEWGHGIDDRYGGISNTSTDGLSEGWGDIFGLYLVDSPNLGSGFQSPNVPLRSGNNTKLYGTQTEVHNAGEVWMGFAWRYRQALRTAFGNQIAIDVSNDTVIGSVVADATNQASAVMEVFLADDDDGNLLNGTPHYTQLSAAAIAKGMPYPMAQVATIAHTPLGTTSARLTPRPVNTTVALVSGGSITQVTLHYNAGAGNVVRNMHPNGATDGYVAMLPGLPLGVVSYHIEALHSGGLTVRLPVSGEFTYQVDNGSFAGFYAENFETGAAGWTHALLATQDDWQLGHPAGRSGTSQGVAWVDPANAASGNNCYGNDLGNTGFNGSYQPNVNNYLRSPVINCTGRTGVRLRFKRWLSVEEATFDHATILVNGVQVWGNPVGTHVQDTAWQSVDYLIPMADNNPAVQIEWHLTSDGGLNLGGWQIDDVELGETVVPNIDAELTMLPEQVVQGNTLTLRVTTPSNARPFVFVLGDTAGPTMAAPWLPTVQVGGTLTAIASATDATGSAVFSFAAPMVPSAVGILFYSQVLTVDAAFTHWVTSNQHVNLITDTP